MMSEVPSRLNDSASLIAFAILTPEVVITATPDAFIPNTR
jgi:hypothetical protein